MFFLLITDINECSQDLFPCWENTICVNLPGGHECRCQDGYEANTTGGGNCTGKTWLLFVQNELTNCVIHTPSANPCRPRPRNIFLFIADINECSGEMFPCGQNTICVNLPGSHECRCQEGFQGNATDGGNCTGTK